MTGPSTGLALEFSIKAALSRAPLREFRDLWRVTHELEQLVMVTAVRKFLEAENWSFRREALLLVELPDDAYEATIDEVIATCGGDIRAALKALLVANEFLEAELNASQQAISAGYARGKLAKLKLDR
jgi:hypothetical protein